MPRGRSWFAWFHSPVNIIASGLFLAGLSLALHFDEKFLLLCAVVGFGPGFLREIGWLRDQDEFQRQAAHRAGYLAYLVGGFVLFLLITMNRSMELAPGRLGGLLDTTLILMWFTWLFSSLFTYWGPQRTAVRVLVIFASILGLLPFVVHWNLPIRILSKMVFEIWIAIVLPGFLIAWIAGRWPRVASVLLLVASGFIVFHFKIYGLISGATLNKGEVELSVVLLAPVLASGFALLSPSAKGPFDA